jgi:hypothetical protein
MSALAMILTAAMSVPGDVPEKVSMEARVEQGLLPGVWEGEWVDPSGGKMDVRVSKNEIVFHPGNPLGREEFQITDEGAGMCRVKLGTSTFLGRYERQGEQLVFAVAKKDAARPTRVEWEKFSQGLITLHPIKPGK